MCFNSRSSISTNNIKSWQRNRHSIRMRQLWCRTCQKHRSLLTLSLSHNIILFTMKINTLKTTLKGKPVNRQTSHNDWQRITTHTTGQSRRHSIPQRKCYQSNHSETTTTTFANQHRKQHNDVRLHIHAKYEWFIVNFRGGIAWVRSVRHGQYRDV